MIGTNAIIDISRHNGDVNLKKAKAAGIVAVIQKATEGTTYVDPKFAINRKLAADAGLLFGAYHFGTGADGNDQADFFLKTVKPGPGDLLVLDFETNPSGTSMSLQAGRDFVMAVEQASGRYPGLYGGAYLKELQGAATDPVLTRCWLWLSQYGPKAVIPAGWKAWTMWQYTDGTAGPEPKPVDGVGKCDRDTYNGTLNELTLFWGGTPST